MWLFCCYGSFDLALYMYQDQDKIISLELCQGEDQINMFRTIPGPRCGYFVAMDLLILLYTCTRAKIKLYR